MRIRIFVSLVVVFLLSYNVGYQTALMQTNEELQAKCDSLLVDYVRMSNRYNAMIKDRDDRIEAIIGKPNFRR